MDFILTRRRASARHQPGQHLAFYSFARFFFSGRVTGFFSTDNPSLAPPPLSQPHAAPLESSGFKRGENGRKSVRRSSRPCGSSLLGEGTTSMPTIPAGSSASVSETFSFRSYLSSFRRTCPRRRDGPHLGSVSWRGGRQAPHVSPTGHASTATS